MPKSDKLVTACHYVRMSSNKQEDSPARQRNVVLPFAKRAGYHVEYELIDEGLTGAGHGIAKREGFQQLIRDAEAGKFEVILCEKIDRFGRMDSLEAGEWVERLRKAGVRLVTALEGEVDWNTFEGRLVYLVRQEAGNQWLMGHAHRALSGKANIAQTECILTALYGFDRVYFDARGNGKARIPHGEAFMKPKGWHGKLSPTRDTVKRETVVWIFETFVNTGAGVSSLVKKLNSKGIPAPAAEKWRAQAVSRILSNPKYIGDFFYGRTKKGMFYCLGDKGEVVKASTENTNAGDPPIYLTDTHEGIVSRELFERAQLKLKDSKISGRAETIRYPLTGLVRCGHCGGAMTGKTTRSGNRKVRLRYYYCSGQLTGTCQKHYTVRSDSIEKYVNRLVQETLSGNDYLKHLADEIRQQAEARKRVKPLGNRALASKIAELEANISKGTRALLLANPDDVPDASAMLSGWRSELADCRTQLKQTQTPDDSDPSELADKAICKIKRLAEEVSSADVMTARTAFRSVFNAITLWWSDGEIRDNWHVVDRIVVSWNKELCGVAPQDIDSTECPELADEHRKKMDAVVGMVAELSNGSGTGVSVREIADALNIGKDSAKYRCRRLVAMGRLQRVGTCGGVALATGPVASIYDQTVECVRELVVELDRPVKQVEVARAMKLQRQTAAARLARECAAGRLRRIDGGYVVA